MGFFDRLLRRNSAEAPASTAPDQPPEWASFFTSRECYDRFDAALRAHFTTRGQRASITDGMLRIVPAPGRPAPDSDDDPLAMGLSNLAQGCALAPEDQWPDIIARHFAIMNEVAGTHDAILSMPLEAARPHIGVRLWDAAVNVVRDKSVWREDIPNLSSVLSLDEPKAVRSLRHEDVQHWNKSEDELFDIALANLPTLAPVNHQSTDLPDDHTLHQLIGDSFFSCAWALRLDQWPDLEGPHGLFFSVPTRHCVLAMPFKGPSSLVALSHLMHITRGLDHEGPGSLSPRVYWRRDAAIHEIPYSLEADKLQVTPPPEFIEYLNSVPE